MVLLIGILPLCLDENNEIKTRTFQALLLPLTALCHEIWSRRKGMLLSQGSQDPVFCMWHLSWLAVCALMRPWGGGASKPVPELINYGSEGGWGTER